MAKIKKKKVGTASACYQWVQNHFGKHEPIKCDFFNHFFSKKTNPVRGTNKIYFVKLENQGNQKTGNMAIC